jgi:hypothetical protein
MLLNSLLIPLLPFLYLHATRPKQVQDDFDRSGLYLEKEQKKRLNKEIRSDTVFRIGR